MFCCVMFMILAVLQTLTGFQNYTVQYHRKSIADITQHGSLAEKRFDFFLMVHEKTRGNKKWSETSGLVPATSCYTQAVEG